MRLLAVVAFIAALILLAVTPQWAYGHQVNVWIRMADCESGDGDGRAPYTASWAHNGYFDGGLQFLPSTWNTAKRLREVRGFASRYGYAYQAPAWVQIRVADNWRRYTSWAQWPACSRKLGLR